ncbi:hypothetical protein [Noviluteimonas dokdonensis]|uniref:hypothetical protein n=1 Tax=Noviluteimonas dokdonensis TaxID=414050 RepID=UPI00126A10AE|nr:hypothetical protein [Lysobacter dokdonensis]
MTGSAHRAMLVALTLLCGACSREPTQDAQAAPATASAPSQVGEVWSHAASPSTVVASSSTAVDAGKRTAVSRPPPLRPAAAAVADYLEAAPDDGPPVAIVTGRQYHAVFAAEKRDAEWADIVEPRLREYFARQRNARAFEIVGLECRSTMCEVLAANRDPRTAPFDVDDWQNVLFAMHAEPWYRPAQLREPSIAIVDSPDHRALFITHLIRE